MSMLWKCLTRLTDPYKRNLKDHTALIALFNAAKDANKDKELLRNLLGSCASYASAIKSKRKELSRAIIGEYDQLVTAKAEEIKIVTKSADIWGKDLYRTDE